MPKRQIFQQEHTPGLEAGKEGAQENENATVITGAVFAEHLEKSTPSMGLRGFRYPQGREKDLHFRFAAAPPHFDGNRSHTIGGDCSCLGTARHMPCSPATT